MRLRGCGKRLFRASGGGLETLRETSVRAKRLDFYKAYLRLLNGKAEPYRTAAAQPLPEKAVFTQSLKPRHSGGRHNTSSAACLEARPLCVAVLAGATAAATDHDLGTGC